MSDNAPGVGSRLGPYLLKRLLGRGGMGQVFEAEDTEMDRVVALKLMSANYSQDPEFRKRLQREARIAGRLQEPHVVPIHDSGEIDGQLYVDMRLIEGTDLETQLRKYGPLNPARAVAIVRQIASALDAAHNLGVLHRDVKPANILITSNDFAYLVDFGIANAVSEEKLTQLGDVLGTWTYMAPERFSGDNDKVTRCADTYALACVLYECLTGVPPFRGNRTVLMTAHLTQPVPQASQQRPGIAPAFDEVIARGMAKTPDDRYQSAGELAAAAKEALSTPDRDRADSILTRSQAFTLPPDLPRPASGAPSAPPLPSPMPGAAPSFPGSAPTAPAWSPPPAAGAGSWPSQGGAPQAPAAGASWPYQTGSPQAPQAPAAGASWPYQPGGPAAAGSWPSQPGQPTAAAGSWPSQAGPSASSSGGFPAASASGGYPAASASGGFPAASASGGFPAASASGGWPAQPGTMAGAGYPTPAQGKGSSKRKAWIIGGAAALVVAVVAVIVIVLLPSGSNGPPVQVELPFKDLKGPGAVAVDSSGNVYVGDIDDNRVVKLAAGSSTTTDLPFTGLKQSNAMAVDSSGNLYIADGGNNQVLKLAAGASSPTKLPFDVSEPTGVAVDTNGNVYVADAGNNRILKLASGESTPTTLDVRGVNNRFTDVAVDKSGNVYIADSNNHRVLELPNGASSTKDLPFTGLDNPNGQAVDDKGNVYVSDANNEQVLKLPSGASSSTKLGFTGLHEPGQVAVDKDGNVYVADVKDNRVLKLAQS